jgi:hypothetical protein
MDVHRLYEAMRQDLRIFLQSGDREKLCAYHVERAADSMGLDSASAEIEPSTEAEWLLSKSVYSP